MAAVGAFRLTQRGPVMAGVNKGKGAVEKGVERASEWSEEPNRKPSDPLEEAARDVGLTAAEAANAPGECGCDSGEPVG
jgi:hypothetical protein